MKRTTLGLAIAGVVALAATVDASIISVNFTESAGHANQQMAAGTTAGFGGYANWNNTAGGNGTLGSLTDSDGATTGASVTWLSNNMWGDGVANPDADAGIGDAMLARGYLDDGNHEPAQEPTWTVTGHGYATYDVVIYLSTDGDGGTYLPFTINGTDYSATGDKHRYTNPNWDASNTIVATGLTGDLVVTGYNRYTIEPTGSGRGSVAGFQVIPEPATFGMLAVFGGGILFIRRRLKR